MNNTNKTKPTQKPLNLQRQKDGPPAAEARCIKLGIDVHLHKYVVVRMIDGLTPQPAQRFSPEGFLAWVQKQLSLAEQVCTAYEAGPLGYTLHRQLEQAGIKNVVVRPRDWDEYGKKVKTDKRDAKELVLALDRYLEGNREAFSVVRVPRPEEEQRRSISRHRESLHKDRQRLAARGRGYGLYYGYRLQGQWWKARAWKKLATQLPAHLVDLLESLRRLLLPIEAELQKYDRQIEAVAPLRLPIGLGKLTYEILEREVVDWHRFKNRRQVASYTGLCPREDSSDQRRFQGSINKHGNPRLRPALVEAQWRLCFFQPEYRLVQKWGPLLRDPKINSSRRKKIIVAMGRAFAVDWWRVRTGRCQPEDLGLKLNTGGPEMALSAATPKKLAFAPRNGSKSNTYKTSRKG